jgi:hypothetical protein
MPRTSRRPSVFTAVAIITAVLTVIGSADHPLPAHLHVGGVDPQVRPFTLDRAAEEGADPLIELLADAADLAFGDAGHAHRCQRHRSVPARDGDRPIAEGGAWGS